MMYDDANRGKITNPERKRQLIDFSKLKYGKITPTDIDGFIEKDNNMFMFYEYKLLDTDMPFGQRVAYTRLVDALTDAGKQAVLFICRHNQVDTNKEINGSDCIVDSYYFHGKWHPGRNKTAKELSDSFIRYTSRENGKTKRTTSHKS